MTSLCSWIILLKTSNLLVRFKFLNKFFSVPLLPDLLIVYDFRSTLGSLHNANLKDVLIVSEIYLTHGHPT